MLPTHSRYLIIRAQDSTTTVDATGHAVRHYSPEGQVLKSSAHELPPAAYPTVLSVASSDVCQRAKGLDPRSRHVSAGNVDETACGGRTRCNWSTGPMIKVMQSRSRGEMMMACLLSMLESTNELSRAPFGFQRQNRTGLATTEVVHVLPDEPGHYRQSILIGRQMH